MNSQKNHIIRATPHPYTLLIPFFLLPRLSHPDPPDFSGKSRSSLHLHTLNPTPAKRVTRSPSHAR
ncbi:MAG TPA: hypothetical protein V6D31_10085 [Candidatus Sericytochromatia bacterium]